MHSLLDNKIVKKIDIKLNESLSFMGLNTKGYTTVKSKHCFNSILREKEDGAQTKNKASRKVF
jgi:hypothetical protein